MGGEGEDICESSSTSFDEQGRLFEDLDRLRSEIVLWIGRCGGGEVCTYLVLGGVGRLIVRFSGLLPLFNVVRFCFRCRFLSL